MGLFIYDLGMILHKRYKKAKAMKPNTETIKTIVKDREKIVKGNKIVKK